jgi:hypothetical protein
MRDGNDIADEACSATRVDDELTAHVEMVHTLAAPLAGKGKLIVASFGQDPATGANLSPKVEHFAIGNVDGMVAAIWRLAQEPHRNVYVPCRWSS